jgi:hypothetical protein
MNIEASGEASTSPQAPKRTYAALKKINFSIILLFLWVIFVHLRVYPRQHSDAHPDPNPAVKNNADPCGSGSTTMVYTILWRSSLHIYIYLLAICALLLWRPKAINL